MVFRQNLSRGDAIGSWQVRDRNQTEAIKGIFTSSGGLFSVFGVASSTYINETRVQQPLVNPN
jgi:hypothetical protein